MRTLPDLGVGVMWFAGLRTLIAESEPAADFYEFEPVGAWARASWSGSPAAGSELRELEELGKPMLVHSVTCAVGGTVPPRDEDVDQLAKVARRLDTPWVSEHLSIGRLRTPDGRVRDAGFLLPPAQNAASVRVAAGNLRHLQARLDRPVAFETGVNYLQRQSGHMSDGRYFAEVAEAADCYILCDLYNLWCNERNGRDAVLDVISELPLERVCELHLAGGEKEDGYHLDAHSGVISDELLELAVEVAGRLPQLRAVVYELMPDYAQAKGFDAELFALQIQHVHKVWQSRGVRSAGIEDPRHWEMTLERALRCPEDDSGIDIYRNLIRTMRAGNIVTTLPLTYRLLIGSIGAAGTDELIDQYLRESLPCAWADDEAHQFRDFIHRTSVACPHLEDVLNFELGATRPRRPAFPYGFVSAVSPLPSSMRCETLSLYRPGSKATTRSSSNPRDLTLPACPPRATRNAYGRPSPAYLAWWETRAGKGRGGARWGRSRWCGSIPGPQVRPEADRTGRLGPMPSPEERPRA